MSIAGKWGTSSDNELYDGEYDTKEEAMAAAKEYEQGFIAQYRDPFTPESCIDADDIIDQCVNQDDYCGEWAEGWPDSSKEQEDELTAAIRKAFAEWLDKHSLRPRWGIVDLDSIIKLEEDGC